MDNPSEVPRSMELPEPARRLNYQPALDGLRAVALLGVVAYHAGIEQFRGGFLGVSSFFTLSGFLITSLLVVERMESERIRLSAFWVRRLRRLFPAALAAITAIVVLASIIGDDSQLARLRTDALASLFHFSNWRFIVEGDSYGALFQSPSPFRHFWSLAVEEQYYLVFPLVMAGALRVCRGPSRRFLAGLAVAIVIAVAWPAILLAGGAATDRLYFGTDTRLAEMLLGASLALWWVRRGRTVPDSPVVYTAAGGLAAVVLVSMWATAHPDDRYLYQGGLAAHAVLTLVVILAAIAPRGPIRTVLSWEPLRLLGVISYGSYLIHWPVLLYLQQESSLGPEARFLVATPVTIGLAALSYQYIEGPFRRMPTATARRRVWLAIPASLTVAVVVVVVTAWQQPDTAPIDFAGAESALEELTTEVEPQPTDDAAADDIAPDDVGDDSPSQPVAGDGTSVVDVTGPVRLAGFGDSTALMTGLGLAYWAEDHPDELAVVFGDAKLGCGLVTGGTRRLEGREVAVPDECDGWLARWDDVILDQGAEVAFIQLGAWEIVDHQVEPDGPFLAIGRDDNYEEMLYSQLRTTVAELVETVDLVALVAHPDVGQARLDAVPPGVDYPEYDPARSARWREVVAEIAGEYPGQVVVIDLAGFLEGRDDDLRLRPDGVHFTAETAEEVADWLAPQIIAEYRATGASR